MKQKHRQRKVEEKKNSAKKNPMTWKELAEKVKPLDVYIMSRRQQGID
jgi:hypothetical protein